MNEKWRILFIGMTLLIGIVAGLGLITNMNNIMNQAYCLLAMGLWTLAMYLLNVSSKKNERKMREKIINHPPTFSPSSDSIVGTKDWIPNEDDLEWRV